MPISATPQVTDFSRDLIGRCVCNGLDERLRSRRAARELSRASNSRARGRLLVDGRPQLLEELPSSPRPYQVMDVLRTATLADASNGYFVRYRTCSSSGVAKKTIDPVSVFEATPTITVGDLHAADVSSSGDDDERRVANQQ
jgi:hypothetical protein